MQPPPSIDRGHPVATIDIQKAHQGNWEIPTEEQFTQWVSAVLAEHSIDAAEMTIRTVDLAESQQLNRDYRGKDAPTNVLSFPFDDDIPLPVRLLGDLVICVPLMAEEALQHSKPVLNHWAHLIVHGTLHLLGYDHIEDEEAEEMEALEIQLLKKFNIADPYQKELINSHE